MKRLSVITIVVMVLLSACVQAQSVTPDQFETGLKNKDVQLLDVRTPEEYEQEHIANALLANIKDKAEFDARVNTLDKSKPVYVYCHSGRRSHTAAEQMRKNGFKNVVELDGGIVAWEEAGKKTETAKPEQH